MFYIWSSLNPEHSVEHSDTVEKQIETLFTCGFLFWNKTGYGHKIGHLYKH